MNVIGTFQPVNSDDAAILNPAVMATGVADYDGDWFVIWRVLLRDEQFEARLTVSQAREIANALNDHAHYLEDK